MRLIINISFLLFITMFSLSAKTDTAREIPYATHIFSSDIYDVYLHQLQHFMDEQPVANPPLLLTIQEQALSEFQNATLQLIQLIKQGPMMVLPEMKLNFHKNMILQLREVIRLKPLQITSNELTQGLKAFVDDLCLWMYTTPKLLNPMQNFLKKSFPASFPSLLEEDHWIDQLSTLYDSINNSEDFGGIIKTPHSLFNAHQNGDIPSLLYSISSESKQTKLIRTSNTTYNYAPDGSGEVITEIIPEFANYLETIANQGKKHLYINYIERQRNNGHHEADILEDLENDPHFGSAIAVVSLARNSIFYKQLDPYSALGDTESFKSAFINELFADPQKGHYYWPQAVNLLTWQTTVATILNDVHANYFSNNVNLSITERQQFIDVAYVKMTEHLISILQPDVVNLSCAISIDRGPVGFTLLYIDLLQQKGKIDVKDLKTIATLIYGPGAIVRNRSVDPEHYQRFIGAANRLLIGNLKSPIFLD